MKQLGFILVLLFSFPCSAQTGGWARNSTGPGELTKIKTDRFGNVFLGGSYYSFPISFGLFTLTPGSANNFIFLTKYDKSGNVRWVNSIGRLGCSPTFGIGTDSLGNLYATAEIGSYVNIQIGAFTVNNNTSQHHTVLVKYDSSGTVQWVKMTEGDYTESPVDMVTDPGGNNYILGGFQSSILAFGPDTLRNTWGKYAVFLAKYDRNGIAQWGRAATINSPQAAAIALDGQRNVCITGNYSNPYTVFGKDTLKYLPVIAPFFVVKYSPGGNVIWARNGAGGGLATGIAATENGAVYATGNFGAYRLIAGTDTLYNTQAVSPVKTDIYLVRYDASGQQQWIKQGSGIGNDASHCLATDASGNVYMTITNDSVTSFGTYSLGHKPNSKYPVGVFMFDSLGQPVDTVMMESGMDGWVTTNSRSEVFISGNSYVPSMFLSPDTVNVAPGTTHAVFVWKWKVNNSQPSIVHSVEKFALKIYPNPATNTVTVSIRDSLPGQLLQVSLSGMQGSLLMQRQSASGEVQLNVANLPAGHYLLNVSAKALQTTRMFTIVR